MKILVIGAGPAGLFFAIQMRRLNPDANIRVVERNPEGATYGFGVALQAKAAMKLATLNPELLGAISKNFHLLRGQDITLGNEVVEIDRSEPTTAGAIERSRLLQVLTDHARSLGLSLEFETTVDPTDSFSDYDLVVAADGGNSAIRDQHAEAFGTRKSELENRFAWYGTKAPFEAPGLAFRKVGESVFVAHYYQHMQGGSSFVAECDAETWNKHGFGDLTDAERKAVFEDVFAKELGGEKLIESRSVWRRWPICENDNWIHNNIVLIGDARHAAHPTIGSGTRIAFDDAHALATALSEGDASLADRLQAFQTARRASVSKLASAMIASYMWYEDVRIHMTAHPLDFAYDFMTRTGRLDENLMRMVMPKFMDRYSTHIADRSAAE